jgi:hypothetical protein
LLDHHLSMLELQLSLGGKSGLHFPRCLGEPFKLFEWRPNLGGRDRLLFYRSRAGRPFDRLRAPILRIQRDSGTQGQSHRPKRDGGQRGRHRHRQGDRLARLERQRRGRSPARTDDDGSKRRGGTRNSQT